MEAAKAQNWAVEPQEIMSLMLTVYPDTIRAIIVKKKEVLPPLYILTHKNNALICKS
jgi:hypothetical protein